MIGTSLQMLHFVVVSWSKRWVHFSGQLVEAMAACGGVHLILITAREEEVWSLLIQWIESPAEVVTGSLWDKLWPPVLLLSRETVSLNSVTAIEREILILVFPRSVCHVPAACGFCLTRKSRKFRCGTSENFHC